MQDTTRCSLELGIHSERWRPSDIGPRPIRIDIEISLYQCHSQPDYEAPSVIFRS